MCKYYRLFRLFCCTFIQKFIFSSVIVILGSMTGLTLNRVVVLARHGARSSTFTIEQFGTPGWVDEDLFNIPKKIQQINYNVTGVNNGRKPPKYDVHTLPCGGINGRLTTRGYNGNLAIGEHIR